MRSTKLPSWIERALGLQAQPLPPNVFAVDGASLRFASFRKIGGELELRAAARHDWPEAVFASGPLGGPVAAPETLQAGIEAVRGIADEPVREAALVLPDEWMRTVFASVGELPRGGKARDEILRWKLKQLVPFRVDELRLRGERVPALPSEDAPVRLLLGFAAEQLLTDLEAGFGAAGIRLGWISNETLATARGRALETAGFAAGSSADQDLRGVLLVRPRSYSLTVFDGGQPLLLRLKPVGPSLDDRVLLEMARRELVLTADFLAEQFPGRRLGGFAVLAHSGEDSWVSLIGEALGVAARVHPPGEDAARVLGASSLPWHELAPMVGASEQRVA